MTHAEATELLAKEVTKRQGWFNLSEDDQFKTIASRWMNGACGYPKLSVEQIKQTLKEDYGCDFLEYELTFSEKEEIKQNEQVHLKALSILAKHVKEKERWISPASIPEIAVWKQRWFRGRMAGVPVLKKKDLMLLLYRDYECKFLPVLSHDEAIDLLARKVTEKKKWFDIQRDKDLKIYAARWAVGNSGFPKLSTDELRSILIKDHQCNFLNRHEYNHEESPRKLSRKR